jgi:hypothetical protein
MEIWMVFVMGWRKGSVKGQLKGNKKGTGWGIRKDLRRGLVWVKMLVSLDIVKVKK